MSNTYTTHTHFRHALLFAILGGLSLLPLYAQDIEKIAKAKPLDWSGSITANADVYAMQPDSLRRSSPYFWNVTGTPVLKIYGMSLPFSLAVGRQRPSANYPVFNQIGVSPTYKWLKVHAGYRNMTLSNYTLNGHTFFGGGIEMNPGKFRFAAMYGRFQQAIREGDAGQSATSLGTIAQPQYQRIGFGGKIGIGKEKNYFDLILFKGKDDSTSIPLPTNLAIRPAENGVVGTVFHFTFWKKLTWDTDAALSFYTRDQSSEVLPDTIDGYKIPKYSIFMPRTTTRANTAVRSTMAWKGKTGNIKLRYERIDPNYSTMGAYFFANDVENITLGVGKNFFRSKVTFSGTGGVQRNNLLNNRSEQTNRIIGAANLNINPKPEYGITFSYSNFSMQQQPSFRALNDSIRIASITQSLTAVPRFTHVGERVVQVYTLVLMYQFLDDLNRFTEQYGDMQVQMAAMNNALSWTEGGHSFNYGANMNQVQVAGNRTLAYGATAGYSKPLADDKGNISASATYNINRFNDQPNGAVLNISLTGSYALAEKHRLSLNALIIRNTVQQTLLFARNFSEYRAGISYTWVLR